MGGLVAEYWCDESCSQAQETSIAFEKDVTYIAKLGGYGNEGLSPQINP
jgi:hypothetical protein